MPLDFEPDIQTLKWVFHRLNGPEIPLWDPNLTCKVQINPAMIPLSGTEPKAIAHYLRVLATEIEEGLWNVGVHCMGRLK